MKSVGKDHRIYCEKAYKSERQDIFHTVDETKNRTCLNILEQHFKIFNLILALNVILWLTQL